MTLKAMWWDPRDRHHLPPLWHALQAILSQAPGFQKNETAESLYLGTPTLNFSPFCGSLKAQRLERVP